MEKYIVEGGNQLKGKVKISGAKNAALPIIIATLLTDNEVILYRIPNLKDIQTTISIIEFLGKKVLWVDESTLKIVSYKEPYKEGDFVVAPYELIKKMRASFLVSGALLANYKKVKAALPGGCAIGARPVDIHINAFEQLGVKHYVEGGYEVFIKNNSISTSKKIKLRYPSVGATENIMLFASKIPHQVTIVNAAAEPEVVDLANFLMKLGVSIDGAGTNVIRIRGCKKFVSSKIEHQIIPDRIEAGTYVIAAGITKGELIVEDVVPEHLNFVIKKLRSTGLKIETDNNSIYVRWVHQLKPQNVVTRPYPFFPTDLQAQFMALMSVTKGTSKVKETVFENRFLHVSELNRMGANIVVKGNVAIVNGVDKLTGAEVMVSDLRAGAALVLAGLAAEGVTKISHIYHLDRGYEKLEQKLTSLGAKICRVRED